jgi:filamentous hemagglutinin family protein
MRFRTLLLLSAALPVAAAHAGPQGGTVVGGSATIQGQGTGNVTVNQFSQNAIVNWNTFNIGAGERTQFVQPNASSIILNRVTGGQGPSQILGTIDANGKVLLVNRDGIIFGAGAVINTAGFLATTADIKNDDFMAGRYNFSIPGRNDASIVNEGRITATSGGFAALVAPGVRNSGTITANLGTVVLGAGNTFTANLDFYGDKLIQIGVGDAIASQVKDVATGQPLKALITNDGKLKANGGRVELTAAAARTVVDAVINTSGTIEANSVREHNGQIVLSAATAATKGSGAPTQTVQISGKLSAAGHKAGTKGGKIVVTGENISVANATIDASGREGGGSVMIGGDWGGGKPNTSLVNNQSAVLDGNAIPTASSVSIDANTRINASAIDRGNGGKVIVWSDGKTTFAGTILALGGTEFGNGGFIETSGKTVEMTGTINAGRGGTWLLDPDDLTINSSLAATIMATLNGGTNVVQQTTSSGTGGNGDIFVTAQIVWNSSATLTLNAYRNIIINDTGPTATIRNTGAGNLVLRANAEGAFAVGSGNGIISMPAGTFATRVDWTASSGTVTAFYNPSSYATPTDFTTGNGRFSLASSNQLIAYMLVNTATELALVGTSGDYALSKDISISTGVFSPIGSVGTPFNGRFNGQGHTISGLNIAPNITALNSIGMFAAIGTSGSVSNLTLANASVTANPLAGGTGQFVGVLAGQNSGTISNVTVANSTISNGTVTNGVLAGGLVGQNSGTISNASAQVAVTVGNSTTGSEENNAGGLVGVNAGSITASSASGTITGGTSSNLGGLVGRNESSGTITVSSASGAVTLNDGTGSTAGGLVGFNFGAIAGSNASGAVTSAASSNTFQAANIGGLAGINDATGTIQNSFATGAVSGGAAATAGGLVGSNNGGTITGSHATGAVSSDSFAGGLVGFSGSGSVIDNSYATGAVSGNGLALGGFAGVNEGEIRNSYATGTVSGNSFAFGGFVGENNGVIIDSHATGNVSGTGGGGFSAGGFAGTNSGSISNSYATGSVSATGSAFAGGFVGGNVGDISGASASGNVTGDASSLAGGFAGANFGTISGSTASGNVSVGDGSFAGGFVAFNMLGTIDTSRAFGSVTAGSESFAAGFASINVGTIDRSSASGAVTAGDNSFVGGFVSLNLNVAGIGDGTISQSYALGATTGGRNSFVGGFAALNLGSLDQTYAAGLVTAGAGGTTGGLVATASNTLSNFFVPNVSGPQPTLAASPGTATNSYWDTTTTGQSRSDGGTGLTSTQFTAGLPSGFDPQVWSSSPGSYPCLNGQCNPAPRPGPAAPNSGTPDDPPTTSITQVSPLVNITLALLNDFFQDRKQDDVINTSNTSAGGGGGGGGGGAGGAGGNSKGGNQRGAGGRPPIHSVPPIGLGPLPSGMPPIGETRFLSNEVVMQLGLNLTPQQITALQTKYGLEVISSQSFSLLGRTVYRFRITGGLTVREVIAGLQSGGPTISGQPSYQFALAQDNRTPASTTSQGVPAPAAPLQSQGDSAQYIVAKLGLVEAHGIATGKGVKIAVIDSEIDAQHPDLKGVVAGSYDALPSSDQTPHSHGTGMAGAIGSHQRLLGIAPGARILGIRAFGVNSDGAQGTSMNIVKGLEWAVAQGAQIINMSFAGPRDPILEQALKALKDRGIILVGAAGNAGPKSPPLFPGADRNVIGVSATDMDDKTYKGANRGAQVAIAAPGVDILVPAPDGGYQLTTGTSVAAAEISGVIALMLERNPQLSPNDVRNILTATAKKLPQGRLETGAGLVDPVQALVKSGPKQASAD